MYPVFKVGYILARCPVLPDHFIQWVNPKAWTMALTAITAYAPNQTLGSVIWVALVFGIVNLPSVSLWTVLGEQMARFLTSAARLRAFNWLMAALLVASLYPVVFT
ncbi:hypothetical protein LY10_03150 [Planktotalea frisia]|nr:hypothetical protein LY10_03150 [Planktotalea frisia]